MEKTKTNPHDYIKSLAPELQADIKLLDAEISQVLKKYDRVMWEGIFWGGSEQKIIGYGSYAYVGSNKKPGEWFVIGLAQQKNYITVFINGAEGGKYLAEKYGKAIGKAKIGKSTVSFKKLADIDLKKLLELIKKAADVMLK